MKTKRIRHSSALLVPVGFEFSADLDTSCPPCSSLVLVFFLVIGVTVKLDSVAQPRKVLYLRYDKILNVLVMSLPTKDLKSTQIPVTVKQMLKDWQSLHFVIPDF